MPQGPPDNIKDWREQLADCKDEAEIRSFEIPEYENIATDDDSVDNESDGDACCFLVSSALRYGGINPASSPLLDAMKHLTRGHVLKTFSGKKDYVRYGRVGPALVEVIQSQPDASCIWREILGSTESVVALVNQNKLDAAYAGYQALVHDLQRRYL